MVIPINLWIAASQAIWQSKVAPDVQGRLFAVRRAIAWSAQLVAPLFAAPLVDLVFRPAMAPGGALAVILGPYIGIGGSRGARRRSSASWACWPSGRRSWRLRTLPSGM